MKWLVAVLIFILWWVVGGVVLDLVAMVLGIGPVIEPPGSIWPVIAFVIGIAHAIWYVTTRKPKAQSTTPPPG